MVVTYKDSGVDILLGDEVSNVLYNAAKETWKNRDGLLGELVVPFDDFSGFRAIDVSHLPEGTLMNMGFDGVGTKMEGAERIGCHATIAHDLFAMVCDDALVRGAEPVIVGSVLDVRSLNDDNGQPFLDEVKELASGYIDAAREANVAVVNGEVAEIGDRVGGYGNFNYNWSAAVVWFASRKRMFTGREICKGDFLVGLKEDGFRSNGLSLVRRVASEIYGEEWHNQTFDGKVLGRLVLAPSRIYTKAVVNMFGGYCNAPKVEVHGFVHITGGGIPGKLGRVLKPSGLGAIIDDSFKPPAVMKHFQELSGISDEEAYQTWNMGQGGIVITPNPNDAIRIAGKHSIDAKIIGRVTKERGINIRSLGCKNAGYLRFDKPD